MQTSWPLFRAGRAGFHHETARQRHVRGPGAGPGGAATGQVTFGWDRKRPPVGTRKWRTGRCLQLLNLSEGSRRGRGGWFISCPTGWCEKSEDERAGRPPPPTRLPSPPPPEESEAYSGHGIQVQFIEGKEEFAPRPRQLSLGRWAVLLPWRGMETKHVAFWLLVLVVSLYLVSWVHEYFRGGGQQESTVRLDMAGDSAGYVFEQTDQSDELAIRCLQEELSRCSRLRRVWRNARMRTELAEADGLRREHLLAVNAYTQHDFYAIFNRALRTYGANDSIYASHFRFKCYHYLLSVALEKLRGPLPGSCRETFRGMEMRAVGGNGSEMRFGFFASSSAHHRIAENFGAATVFTIRSQYGVPIQNFSDFPEEEEVLIPPYEVFRIEYPAGSDARVVLTSCGRQVIPVRLDEIGGGRVRVSRVTPAHVAMETPEP